MGARKKAKRRREPWKRGTSAKAKHTKLTSGQKKSARKRAARAGRPYPNLVDNMAESRSSRS